MEALLNIEAMTEDGVSLGIADVITFRKTSDEAVSQFEACWPYRDQPTMHKVVAVRLNGRLMMINPTVIGPGEALRVKGYCNARLAQGGKLDG